MIKFSFQREIFFKRNVIDVTNYRGSLFNIYIFCSFALFTGCYCFCFSFFLLLFCALKKKNKKKCQFFSKQIKGASAIYAVWEVEEKGKRKEHFVFRWVFLSQHFGIIFFFLFSGKRKKKRKIVLCMYRVQSIRSESLFTTYDDFLV